MRRLRIIGVLLAAGLLAAACSSGSSSDAAAAAAATSSGREGVLTIPTRAASCGPAGSTRTTSRPSLLSFGLVYEPLVFVNPLQNGKTTPMLATAWKWGTGNKTLTFTIRKGVKFNNGTADDRRPTSRSPSTC